jgi:hypothetical protein
MPDFLSQFDLRPLPSENLQGLKPRGYILGQGVQALEVLITEASCRPTTDQVRKAWQTRWGRRPVPVVLVILYDGKAGICASISEKPAVYLDLEVDLIERLCSTALTEPDRHSAARFLKTAIAEIDPLAGSKIPGLRNEGLFALHELDYGVRQERKSEWQAISQKYSDFLNLRGEELIRSLGFEITQMPGATHVLVAKNTKVALAVFLDRSEGIETPSARFGSKTPISYALYKAEQENLKFVIVSSGPVIRLYPTQDRIGVGRRGIIETYVELTLSLLRKEDAGFLGLFFSADALSKDGSFYQVLQESEDFAADLGKRLRDKIYEDVIPNLALAVLKARGIRKPNREKLNDTYEMALILLFRFLFIAYAEDKGLLPYHNEIYKKSSLKQIAKNLREIKEGNRQFDSGSSLWDSIRHLFAAVDRGNTEWGVPDYNGGMFSTDPDDYPLGAEIEKIKFTNTELGPILCNLLLEQEDYGLAPIDFRSLGVREFGTIYEGLLESELSIAETDLVVDSKGNYSPAKGATKPRVKEGDAYLHNKSGVRKSSGSFYTKPFAVEHLLQRSLEPALDSHLARLDAMTERQAGEAFFDFRVADIAMGSGHFLVAAIDKIEKRMVGYLIKRQLADVVNELSALRHAAKKNLAKYGETIELDDPQLEDTRLLRRQIARRCIYGVDINNLAVELARLSVWIHTFVPGLPLSFLDHNLVQGNSLVGIGTIEEAEEIIGQELFSVTAIDLLGEAELLFREFGSISDADATQVKNARETIKKATNALEPTRIFFDILTASRLNGELLNDVRDRAGEHGLDDISKLRNSKLHTKAKEAIKFLPPFHFPIAFPEVFLRERSGFDVIIGNPPWEEVLPEEHHFWFRYEPGIRSLSEGEKIKVVKKLHKERQDLVIQFESAFKEAMVLHQYLSSEGTYPGMEIGDSDIYKAFCWRFWRLVNKTDGSIGVVLPRSVFAGLGMHYFRMEVFSHAEVTDLTLLLNNKSWVFDEVHPQYTIVLSNFLCGKQGHTNSQLRLIGSFSSLRAFEIGMGKLPVIFPTQDVLGWTDSAAIPLLPGEESAEVFAQLRKAPRLDINQYDRWRARPLAELHATHDKPLMKFTDKPPDGYWPVFKGESFDIWAPDTGEYYAWANPEKITEHLQKKRSRAAKSSNSPFFEFSSNGKLNARLNDKNTLPCMTPRIAFRDITNRTNRRTVIVSLVPSTVLLVNTAPYLLWPRGDEKDQAYLLGVLSSIPLDWYARRFVELHVNFHILNPFPIPRPSRDNPLWQRVVELSGRLASPDKRFAAWAKKVGVPYGRIEGNEKEDMIAELDAVVSLLYGLSEKQVAHIFESFHEGWDYETRLRMVLKHYGEWKKRS